MQFDASSQKINNYQKIILANVGLQKQKFVRNAHNYIKTDKYFHVIVDRLMGFIKFLYYFVQIKKLHLKTKMKLFKC